MEMITERRIRHLPVLVDGKLCGIKHILKRRICQLRVIGLTLLKIGLETKDDKLVGVFSQPLSDLAKSINQVPVQERIA